MGFDDSDDLVLDFLLDDPVSEEFCGCLDCECPAFAEDFESGMCFDCLEGLHDTESDQ